MRAVSITEDTPVSVIIPCFNSADTLARAVASVAGQTRLPREVILVDDASTDNTAVVIQRIAQEYPQGWIKVITLTENSGPATARNAGWAFATSSYIAFLDSDDSWHPQKLEIQFQWMSEHPEFAFCGHLVARKKLAAGAIVLAEIKDEAISEKRLLFSSWFFPTSVLLRRDLPVRFEPGKWRGEDTLLWLRLTLAGFRGAMLLLPLARAYKPPYGASGLSANLWAMERGELESFSMLRRDGQISIFWWAMASGWSLLRFVRRIILVALRTRS